MKSAKTRRPNAIADLVSERMREKGWSSYDVASHVKGLSPRTVSHWARPQSEWTNLPKEETVEKMADALYLPLARLQQAVLETLGYDVADVKMPNDIRLVVAAMGQLSPERQKDVADMVLRLIETFRDDR